jgi:hypothetical protein
MPERFPSSPAGVFPLYHVFRDLADLKAGHLVEATASEPLLVDGLAVRVNEATHVLLANLTPRPQAAIVGRFPAKKVRVRLLDENTAAAALSDPEAFARSGTVTPVADGRLRLELLPYAVARIDEI